MSAGLFDRTIIEFNYYSLFSQDAPRRLILCRTCYSAVADRQRMPSTLTSLAHLQ
jgi:hypothetical protein